MMGVETLLWTTLFVQSEIFWISFVFYQYDMHVC